MRFFIGALTIVILLFFGHALKNILEAGSWIVVPFALAGVLMLGYFVGDEADKDGFRNAWGWVKARLLRR